jgi:O-antigen/teichoic acid export membrane protein
MTKEKASTPTKATPQAQPDSNLAIISMILGVVSLTGPGLLLGIPAIVTSSIALKRNLSSRGLSIVGLVTGIISTTLSIIFLAFLAFLVVWGINHPEEFDQNYQTPGQSEQSDPSDQTYHGSST